MPRRDRTELPGWDEVAGKLLDAAVDALTRTTLSELRQQEGISQDRLAESLGVTQGAVSKFEHAADVRVSTLRAYLGALGADLEVAAVFRDDARRAVIDLAGDGSR